jgi:hypothetical protein
MKRYKRPKSGADMDARPAVGGRTPRTIVSSLVLLLALTFVVLPANAGPRSATTTIADHGDCSFTATYTWSGFSGTELVAELAFEVRLAGGANAVLAKADFPNQVGSGGPVSATFTLTGTPTPTSFQFFARGNLFTIAKKNSPYTLTGVRDSVVYSSNTGAQACGTIVTVSQGPWFLGGLG